jgi:hypothetical protein
MRLSSRHENDIHHGDLAERAMATLQRREIRDACSIVLLKCDLSRRGMALGTRSNGRRCSAFGAAQGRVEQAIL